MIPYKNSKVKIGWLFSFIVLTAIVLINTSNKNDAYDFKSKQSYFKLLIITINK